MKLEEVGKFGVIGAGQMGGGIAQIAAQSGYEVLLSDADMDRAEQGKNKIASLLDRQVDKGRLERIEAAENGLEILRGADRGGGADQEHRQQQPNKYPHEQVHLVQGGKNRS